MKARDFCLGTMMLMLIASVNAAVAQNIATIETADQKVEIRNLEIKENAIHGEVVNRSGHPLRNIELLVQHHWLWENEFKPGENPPGKSGFFTVEKELRPGETASFTVPLDAPPASGVAGSYVTEVTLSGFTEVLPPTIG
jgi:hypothetical protein